MAALPQVLAVDDETVSRLVLSRMLANLGMEVAEATDVPQAIELLENESFDLVVSDYNMPSGTGIDVARVAKGRGVPFILLTGFSYEDDFESDPDLAPLHLTKPVSSVDLAAAVQSCGIGQESDESTPVASEETKATNQSQPDSPPRGDGATIAGNASSASLDRELSRFEAIGVEVLLLDDGARIVGSTKDAREALGYEQSQWDDLSIFDLIHPDDHAGARQALATAMAESSPTTRTRFRTKHADGHWENIEIHATNLLDDPGVEALVLTTRSVTIEERLRAAHNEATRRASSQVEYVASVSHELRSPLQGILGVAQLLEGQVTGDAANLVDIIGNEAERLRRVIDDILDYAKSDRGAMELDPRPTSIRKVLGDVVDICKPQAEPEVRLLIDVDPAVSAWVEIDDLRLHQVLVNLVANATRFTDSGTIKVSCRAIPSDRLLFEVADTGTGIAPEKLHNLFEPFRQGGTSPDVGGTGLGLTISKNLVGLLGGRLDVESEQGVGSTFSFAIDADRVERPGEVTPAEQQPAESSVPEAADATPRLPRAIVVDDGEVNRMVISRQLELMGYEVDTADGGEVGTEMILANDYHVVVTDWHMPEVDGLDLIARVRSAQEGGPVRTPIITMTASAMKADRERCLNAGADGFLAKPATRAELFEVVGQYLQRESVRSTDATTESGDGFGGAGQAVDLAVLDDLGEQLGNPDAVANVVQSFLGELDRLGAAITDAINGNDAAAVAAAAHTLRAPSFMLGALPLGELCQRFEDRSIDIKTYNTAAFDSQIGETSDALSKWLQATEVTT